MVCVHCGYQLPPLSRPGRKYCSDRCRGRAQRHQPYTGPNRRWTPLHPVDEPAIRFRCANPECREPIYQRNQIWCSAACKQAVRRRRASRVGVRVIAALTTTAATAMSLLTGTPTAQAATGPCTDLFAHDYTAWQQCVGDHNVNCVRVGSGAVGTTYKCSYPDGGQDICIRMDVGISEKVAGACVYYPPGTSPGPL